MKARLVDVASLASSRMPTKFLSLVVRPGERCKISLPGCSALELKQAALAPGGPITERVVLECDLAVKRFVLCSLVPRGPMQATLGTVVTNDPDQAAWLYLTARGPRPSVQAPKHPAPTSGLPSSLFLCGKNLAHAQHTLRVHRQE